MAEEDKALELIGELSADVTRMRDLGGLIETYRAHEKVFEDQRDPQGFLNGGATDALERTKAMHKAASEELVFIAKKHGRVLA